MSTILIRLPQRKRNRIQIIRDEALIEKEVIAREERLGYIRKIEEESKIEAQVIEEVIEEQVEEYKEPEPVKFTQEFVFTNLNQPIVIPLNNIPEPALPIRVVKDEIQKAYERGTQDGQIQAKALYQTELEKYNSWISSFDAIANELKDEHQVALKKLEESVVSISLMVAQHIIGRQATEDSKLVLDMVRKAIDSLENDFVYKIHVHPNSVHILEEVKSSLLDDKEVSNKIVITSDTSVDEGGCVLETSAGMIDARISSQLDMLKKPLINSIKETYEKEQSDELEDLEDTEIARLRAAEEDSMEEMKRIWAEEFEDEDISNENFEEENEFFNQNNDEEVINNSIENIESQNEEIDLEQHNTKISDDTIDNSSEIIDSFDINDNKDFNLDDFIFNDNNDEE